MYQRIPKNGVGKISISFQHVSCQIDAVSLTNEELPSFTRNQIIKKNEITDITDESEYISSIGMKASSMAVNQAKTDVAEQEKQGEIGRTQANMERRIKVATYHAERYSEKMRPKVTWQPQRLFWHKSKPKLIKEVKSLNK